MVHYVYLTPYLWYIHCIMSATHGISIPLSITYQTPIRMVFWPPSFGLTDSYPWYIDPWYITSTIHGILNPYTLFFWLLYPWYIKHPIYSISNRISLVPRPHYPFYVYLLFHAILSPLPMVFRTPYPLYLGPHSHDMSVPYQWYIEPPLNGILNPSTTHGILIPYQSYTESHINGLLNPLHIVYLLP